MKNGNDIQKIFSEVAPKYDLANAILSFGLHKFWKRKLVEMSALPATPASAALRGGRRAESGAKILDAASGTGDLALMFAEKYKTEVYALDLNEKMLEIAKNKALKAGLKGKINFVLGDILFLPFENDFFDIISVGFGLRNVEDLNKALSEIRRVLKPGGKFLCLEFSEPRPEIFAKIYDFYSFHVLPRLGALITGEKVGAYKYLVSSIRKFPDQEEFKKIIESAGFKNAGYENLTFGVVAIHFAEK